MCERKLLRLKNWNYSSPGYYFVTICLKNHEFLFGEIKNYQMYLNEYGEIANQYWQEIPKHFLNIQLDEFVIMPDHIHGILKIKNINDFQGLDRKFYFFVGCADLRTLQKNKISDPSLIQSAKNINKTKTLLPKAIHGFKSSVTKIIRQKYNDYEFAWQKSFNDHIIKNKQELFAIRNYIKTNPKNWKNNFIL